MKFPVVTVSLLLTSNENINHFFILGGQYGNRLLFASVAVNTTMVLSKTGQTEGLKVHDHWENFVKQKVLSL